MIKKVIRGFFALFLMQLLLACGGSDNSCKFNDSCGETDGGGTDTPIASALSLKLISTTTGQETNNISATDVVKLEASVVGQSGDVQVDFSTSKGTLSSDSSLLSDGVQVTPVTLSVGSDTGAGEVTATVTINGKAVTSKVLFAITTSGGGGGNPPTMTLKLVSSSTGLPVTTISAADPGVLIATVDGVSDRVIVNFSATKGIVSNDGSKLTTQAGVASVDLLAGNSVGAGIVTATLLVGTTVVTSQVVFEIKSGSVSTNPTIALKLVSKSTGLPVTTVSSSEPVQLVATLSDTTTTYIVNFTTTKGVVSDSGSALSNKGKAVVDLNVGEAAGAGEATATTVIDGQTVSGTVLFQITSIPTSIDLKLVSSLDETKVVNSISVSDPGRLIATVKVDGKVLTQPIIVNFETTLGTVSNSGSVLTDAKGVATVDLSSADELGAGTVTAKVLIGSKEITSQLVFEIKASDQTTAVGRRLQFISASPETIALKGSGGQETSVVKFKVVDDTGAPVKDEVVSFSLDSSLGGIALDPATAVSNSSGEVSAIVKSGTISTAVRVTARVSNSSGVLLADIKSSLLVISTGIPDQDSFSLSASEFNVEAWQRDGVEVEITARLADGYNNPVPDGTAVAFRAEGGAIQPSCITVGGACTVKWTSQSPRPVGNQFQDGHLVLGSTHGKESLGQPYGGRVTITATAIGEESFTDGGNGNGVLDAGSEMTTFLTGKDTNGDSFDLAEAFTDYNEDGVFDTSVLGGELERFIDFNLDGKWNDKDGKYSGSFCATPLHSGCASKKTITVRKDLVLVMSGSEPYVSLSRKTITLPSGATTEIGRLCISDVNNQMLPEKTDITASFSGILWPNTTLDFKLPSSSYNGPYCIGLSLAPVDSLGNYLDASGLPIEDAGSATVSTTTPSKLESTITVPLE